MGDKENKSGNKKRPYYRKRGKSNSGGNSGTNAKTKSTVREMKFHLHDSQQRKSSESFAKIKEAIITKIKKSFKNPNTIEESLSSNSKKIFTKPKKQESTETDADAKNMQNTMFMEQYKINSTIFRKKEMRFQEQWTKAYALIWDTSCAKDIFVAL